MGTMLLMSLFCTQCTALPKPSGCTVALTKACSCTLSTSRVVLPPRGTGESAPHRYDRPCSTPNRCRLSLPTFTSSPWCWASGKCIVSRTYSATMPDRKLVSFLVKVRLSRLVPHLRARVCSEWPHELLAGSTVVVLSSTSTASLHLESLVR
uniref:Putative secreted protein n=1 Tax=Ixodes ricinus TaxID=34613 RepID=A0A6B0UW58_IXORI